MSDARDLADLERTVRPCPVCGSAASAGRVVLEECLDAALLDRFAFASRKLPELMHWRLLHCLTCDVLFASPAPDPQALAYAYREADYDSGEESRYAARTYGELVGEVAHRLPATGGALDIGAGDGAFLSVLRELGFDDLAGAEPSRVARETADPSVRPLIRSGVFRAEDFEASRPRLISCLHIVEHLPDPLAVLRSTHALLKDGGALLVVCHDRRAPLNRLLGRRSAIYDVEHLQLFSRRSLRELLERAGFQDPEIRGFRNRYPLRYWLRLAPVGRSVKLALIAALDRVRVGSVPLTLPVGNLVAVAWRQPSA